jgi:hypothetical protein
LRPRRVLYSNYSLIKRNIGPFGWAAEKHRWYVVREKYYFGWKKLKKTDYKPSEQTHCCNPLHSLCNQMDGWSPTIRFWPCSAGHVSACFSLFQLILSHRTLLNQLKPAGFSTCRTSPLSAQFVNLLWEPHNLWLPALIPPLLDNGAVRLEL